MSGCYAAWLGLAGPGLQAGDAGSCDTRKGVTRPPSGSPPGPPSEFPALGAAATIHFPPESLSCPIESLCFLHAGKG